MPNFTKIMVYQPLIVKVAIFEAITPVKGERILREVVC